MTRVEHVRATTFHGRQGAVANRFRYSVDYVLVDAERPSAAPRLFSRNGHNLMSLRDADHGGPTGRGRGAVWAREVLAGHGLGAATAGRLDLLAQPRLLGHVFNPVSFWLAHDAAGRLRAVIAEVTNTFGDRHSYLCHRDDKGPIGPADELVAGKVFHVSPFQPVAGEYRFRFDIGPGHVSVRIGLETPEGRMIATLTGPRAPLTAAGLIAALLRRPFGSRRVLGLIHWQALMLFVKGAGYRRRPQPPAREVSR
jgi:DUF1365 family protein